VLGSASEPAERGSKSTEGETRRGRKPGWLHNKRMQRTIRVEAFRPPCGLAAIGVPLAKLLRRGSPLIRDPLCGILRPPR